MKISPLKLKAASARKPRWWGSLPTSPFLHRVVLPPALLSASHLSRNGAKEKTGDREVSLRLFTAGYMLSGLLPTIKVT